jgi:predicted Zn-dependent peptidase
LKKTLLMVRMPLAALLILLLTVLSVQAETLEEKVREYTLDNGLKILTVERPESPTFAAYITLGVGSVDETSEYRGMAHMLEHMLFKGTKTLGTRDYRKEKPLLDQIEETAERLAALRRTGGTPERIAELERKMNELQDQHRELVIKDEFSRIYAEHGGEGYNAFTSKDLTTYLISLPANKLELWAFIESDRMKNAVLREFYTEREVVKEERRRAYETNPRGLLYETLLATAFTVHPYRNPIIGWMSDIENLTLAQTRAFLERYYAPVNTVIALVGDIDSDQAAAMVERYFGDIAPGTPVPPVTAVEPPQRGEKRHHIRFEAEPQLAIAFHKPSLPHKDDYVFDVIDLILGHGRTSRLYQSLVVEKQIATSVSTYTAPGARYPNLFVISAVPRFPHTLAEVEEAVHAELARLAAEPVLPEEMEKALNRLRTDRLRFLQGNSGLARMLTYYQTVAGDWRYLLSYDEEVAGVTPDDIMAAAKRYFTPTNRTVVTLSRELP